MNIELKKIESKDKIILINLFQLYMHDITLSLPMDVNNHGLFEYNETDYYFNNKEGYDPYLIINDNKYIGFVLINKEFMVLNNEENNFNLSEFFILNAYKRKGIGKKIAFEIFDKYKGNFEIKPVPRSNTAKQFWENVIKEYTNNNYKIEYPKPNRITYIFNTIKKD